MLKTYECMCVFLNDNDNRSKEYAWRVDAAIEVGTVVVAASIAVDVHVLVVVRIQIAVAVSATPFRINLCTWHEWLYVWCISVHLHDKARYHMRSRVCIVLRT